MTDYASNNRSNSVTIGNNRSTIVLVLYFGDRHSTDYYINMSKKIANADGCYNIDPGVMYLIRNKDYSSEFKCVVASSVGEDQADSIGNVMNLGVLNANEQ